MPRLDQVFGIKNTVPDYTYVDRSNLDSKFRYFWSSQKHIVIHGASKQGKSCIRKKNLDSSECIIIQCLPNMPCEEVWKKALRQLNSSVPKETTKRETQSISGEVTGKVEGTIPLIVGASTEGKTGTNKLDEKTSSYNSVEGYETDIKFLAEQLIKNDKRLILEDFHYFPEEIRKEIAFHLKALYELNIFVLIIGIWAELDLLVYYNGDLSGRIEEINIGWTKSELFEVLKKGSDALNISFSPNVASEIVESSFENVGLLQRIAENICLIEDIYEKQDKIKEISNIDSLNKARQKCVEDIGQRYNKIKEVFERGFRSDTELKIYYLIFRLLTEAKDQSLINGIPQSEILKKIQSYSSRSIRPGDLTQALDRIERLQASRDITPLLISYNKSLRSISLTDREFLFYRKFGDIKWEWLEDDKMYDEVKKSESNDIRIGLPFIGTEIVQDNSNGTAEIRNNLGKKIISKNDKELNQIIKKLISTNIKFPSIESYSFDSNDMQFYLGFLFKKGFIGYKQIDQDKIEIYLTEKAKEKLKR
ncbi:MAG: hypothetical protein Q7J35_06670 [Candidatus Methanoperedens sp.]|nr:hypothetical protein [Candidatus Methanoperedens sp.]